MKNFLALVAFVAISAIAIAQQNYQEVVYLKNGSIIRGVIIEQIPNKQIKIETADGNIFVFQIDEIEKFTKEPVKKQEPDKKQETEKFANTGLQKGYHFVTEFGYCLNASTYGSNMVKYNVINGYRFNPYFALGFGTGIRCYFDEGVMIPMFADFRANFLNKIVSPYFSLSLGCSFNTSDNFKAEGLLLNPTIGVIVKLNAKSAMHIGFGLDVQGLRHYSYYGYGYWTPQEETTVYAGGFSYNFGFSF